jgi:hypothetical protein
MNTSGFLWNCTVFYNLVVVQDKKRNNQKPKKANVNLIKINTIDKSKENSQSRQSPYLGEFRDTQHIVRQLMCYR